MTNQRLARFQEVGHRSGIAEACLCLGHLAADRGDRAQATRHLTEALALSRQLEDKAGSASALLALGALARQEGDAGRAKVLCREALVLARQVGDQPLLAVGLEHLAAVAAEEGQPQRAARVCGAAEALRAALGAAFHPGDRTGSGHDRYLEEARAALGEAAFGRAWAAGQAMPLEQAIAYALEEAPAAAP